jgi:hypothetical protein
MKPKSFFLLFISLLLLLLVTACGNRPDEERTELGVVYASPT